MVNVHEYLPSAKARLTFEDTYGKEVDVSELAKEGQTVFYFFPAVFTGVCTKSSCELRDDISDFNRLNTRIYGISTDMPASQKVFAKNNDINYPLLSDWNKELIESFGVRDDDFGGLIGVAKRSLFLARDSKIVYKWVADHPGNYPPFDELKNHLR